MAAYGALVSLSHIVHQILHPPPLFNIIINREQIESLEKKVNSFIEFLETSSTTSSQEMRDLEAKIADAANVAADMIESYVVDQIRYHQKTEEKEKKYYTLLYDEGVVQTVREDFHRIEETISVINGKKDDVETKLSTSRPPPPHGKITMVGLEDHIIQIMEALDTGESNRQIIPIVGMGGIGKTTLASAVYNDPRTVECFYVRAWVTVSQEFTIPALLRRLLSGMGKEKLECSDDKLHELLHKELFGRKYLIVMDDVWDIDAFDKVKRCLPGNNNGSRILVTTRLSNLAVEVGYCKPHELGLLDEEKSWDLLRRSIFLAGEDDDELEEIGKSIAGRCRGLPLALAVVGGLLANSPRTRENWESFAGDVSTCASNDEDLVKILALSYIHLPIHLKPCFLYLAMFPEDYEIRVSWLFRLWVAEGLIKHRQAKCLEEVAREYLEDLISRNLILVHKKGSRGKVKYCKIHDLIRDLCIVEAEKQKFLRVVNLDHNPVIISQNIETKRHLSISSPSKNVEITAIDALQSAKYNRSWLSFRKIFDYYDPFGFHVASVEEMKMDDVIHEDFRLLRVVHDLEQYIDVLKLINLRYVVAISLKTFTSRWLSLCWNLQTLDFYEEVTLPAEIWQMPQLRHIKMPRITLPYPPNEKLVVLENLQTLKTVASFNSALEVLIRIPNLKTLKISCCSTRDRSLMNLVCLGKLESLGIKGKIESLGIEGMHLNSLVLIKKLRLDTCRIPWEDLSVELGKMPNLEVLKLDRDATEGEEWNPVEGEFCRLKFLRIWACRLSIWGADSSHFPCLEHLCLVYVRGLKEIPMSFAEILTLEVIELLSVEDSVWTSAKEVSDERGQFGYEPLQVRRLG